MRSLRALIVDDKEPNIEPIQQGLNLELEALGWSVDWETDHNSISARRRIRASLPFDFAIVDLFLNDSEIQDGLEVLRELFDRDTRTYSLLITSFSSKAPGFREAAALYRAHAIDRMDLDRAPRWKLDRLAADIVQHLTGNGLVESVQTTYDRADHAVVSLLDHVGRSAIASMQDYETVDESEVLGSGVRIIRNLAMRCLAEVNASNVELHLDYLAAGKSGAHVCRVDFKRADEPRQAFLLKFGFDKGALDRECRANREASKALGEQSLVRLISDVKTDISGYHAVAARVALGTVTLRDWLPMPLSSQYSTKLAEVLLGELLAPLFDVENIRAVPTVDWLTLTSWEVLRSQATVDRYRSAIESDRAAGLGRAEQVLRPVLSYLGTGRYPAPARAILPERVTYVRAFGDLHSANILVQTGALPRPVFIDATLYGRGHWAADSARLVVDIFLRAWRSGVESMIWSNIPESLHPGMRLCPQSHQGWSELPSSAEKFISACLDNLIFYTCAGQLGVALEDWHWQWHAALAKEFLKQASHDDLPPPRAVLALLLAARHMRLSFLCLRRAHPAFR